MRFSRVAGSVFALVALAHLVRAAQQIPIQVGATAVPVWASWLGAAGAALLSVWGFRSRG